MGVWLSKAFWATRGEPDACSCYLVKVLRAFSLECGYLHVYIWQELTVRLGLSLFCPWVCEDIHLNIFSVMLYYKLQGLEYVLCWGVYC